MDNKFIDLLKPHHRLYRRIGFRVKFISKTRYWKKIDYIYRDFVKLDKFNISYKIIKDDKILIEDFKLFDSEISVFCRLGDSDVSLFIQQFIALEYGQLLTILNERIGAPNVKNIIDCGSNVGFSCLLWSKYYPNSQIIGIEPDNENFELLKSNISLNNSKNILLLKRGFWSNNNLLTFNNEFRDQRSWSVTLKEKNTETGAGVKGVTLAELIEKYDLPSIDLLKIDIEGGEAFILEDPATLNQIKNKVKLIAVELHEDAGVDTKKFTSVFSDIGFEILLSCEYHIFINKNLI